MSQRDYIHDKKMRHILSSKKGLETTPSNHEYTIMKQYTLENKGTTKPKWARTVTSDQTFFRNMLVSKSHRGCIDCSLNGDCTFCNYKDTRPMSAGYQKGPSLYSRNAVNQYSSVQKKIPLGQSSVERNGVNIFARDPAYEFCDCNMFFYLRNPQAKEAELDPYDFEIMLESQSSQENSNSQSGYSYQILPPGQYPSTEIQILPNNDISFSDWTMTKTDHTELYRNGTYTVLASTVQDAPSTDWLNGKAIHRGFHMFNMDANQSPNLLWHSANNGYSAVDGISVANTSGIQYFETIATYNSQSYSLYGEWIQMHYPFNVQLSSYRIKLRQDQGEKLWDLYGFRSFYIVGSNNGTNWEIIDHYLDADLYNDINYSSYQYPFTTEFTMTSTTDMTFSTTISGSVEKYSYIRLVINILKNMHTVHIRTWEMSGVVSSSVS